MAKILIVDDSPTIVAIFKRLFARAGHEVFTAGDGRSGLEAAHTSQPQLVVLDCMLPDMSGIEVCRALKTDERTRSAKVLMLSGSEDGAIEQAGQQAGVDLFLTKQTDPMQLLQTATQLLS